MAEAGRLLLRALRGVLMVLVFASAAAAQSDFPFGQDLILEEEPLAGSKRRPILNIGADGEAEIDLWCRSGTGQVAVAGDSIAIAVGALAESRCTPERMQADAELLADLAGVTTWRRDEDIVELSGPTVLRFRVSSH